MSINTQRSMSAYPRSQPVRGGAINQAAAKSVPRPAPAPAKMTAASIRPAPAPAPAPKAPAKPSALRVPGYEEAMSMLRQKLPNFKLPANATAPMGGEFRTGVWNGPVPGAVSTPIKPMPSPMGGSDAVMKAPPPITDNPNTQLGYQGNAGHWLPPLNPAPIGIGGGNTVPWKPAPMGGPDAVMKPPPPITNDPNSQLGYQGSSSPWGIFPDSGMKFGPAQTSGVMAPWVNNPDAGMKFGPAQTSGVMVPWQAPPDSGMQIGAEPPPGAIGQAYTTYQTKK